MRPQSSCTKSKSAASTYDPECRQCLTRGAEQIAYAYPHTPYPAVVRRALALEPEHHVLREHIGMLTRRLNALAVLRKQIDREDEMTSRLQVCGAVLSPCFASGAQTHVPSPCP